MLPRGLAARMGYYPAIGETIRAKAGKKITPRAAKEPKEAVQQRSSEKHGPLTAVVAVAKIFS